MYDDSNILMSYSCYLYLFPYDGVKHILCCVFCLSLSSSWIFHSWLSIRFSLTFIFNGERSIECSNIPHIDSIFVLVNIKCTTYLFVFSRLFCILYELSCENELLKLLVLVRVTIKSTDRLISRWTLNHVFIFTKQRCKRIHCGLYCQLLCCRINFKSD